MLRNKGFKGPKPQIFDLVYLENGKHFEKAFFNESCLESYSQYYAIFNFSLNGPIKELRGRPLISSFLNISKTVANF